ncbi:MAG: hypothetical protein RLZ57_940 [Actinomycetota bacterium]
MEKGKRHLTLRQVLVWALLLVEIFIPTSTARAVDPGVALTAKAYIDAPFVQASFTTNLNGYESITENFNDFTPGLNNPAIGTCPGSILGFGDPIVYNGTLDIPSHCVAISSPTFPYGGATTTDPSLTLNANGYPVNTAIDQSKSPLAAVDAGAPLKITLTNTAKYVGLWWSAGSYTNEISFYDEQDNLVATLSADGIYEKLSHGTKVKSLGGQEYFSNDYYGHPTDPANEAPDEPFVYIHVIAENNFPIKTIEIKTFGNGFEFDNLTVGNEIPNIPDQLVLASLLYQNGSQTDSKTVTFDTRGGSSIPSQNFIPGESITEPISNPTKENAAFAGWFTSPTGGTQVTFPFTGNDNVIIYARWLQTITFDSQGGSNVDDVDFFSGDSIAQPNDPVKSNSPFIGWYTSSQNGQKISFPYSPDASQTLYAHWLTPSDCLLNYSRLDGTNSPSPIYLNLDGTLISDYVFFGDDALSTNFEISTIKNGSSVQIDSNGGFNLDGNYFTLFSSDLQTVNADGTYTGSEDARTIQVSEDYLTNYENGLCGLKKSFITSGFTEIDGQNAFVITWYKMKRYFSEVVPNFDSEIVGTFQIALISDGGNIRIVRNYESLNGDSHFSGPYATWPNVAPEFAISGLDAGRVFSGYIDFVTNLDPPQSGSLNDLVDAGSWSLATHSYASEVDGRYVYIPDPPPAHTISVSSGSNGSITPETSSSVPDGENWTHTITPYAGFQIDTVTVDGVDVTNSLEGGGLSKTYTFYSVNTDHSINASFKPGRNIYNIFYDWIQNPTFLNPQIDLTSEVPDLVFNYANELSNATVLSDAEISNMELVYKQSESSVYGYQVIDECGIRRTNIKDGSSLRSYISSISGDLDTNPCAHLGATNLYLIPIWVADENWQHASFTELSSYSGAADSKIRLLGMYISRLDGNGLPRNFGYQTIFFKGFNTEWESNWTAISDIAVENKLDGSVEVQVPSGYQKIAFHIDWCPIYLNPEFGYCQQLNGIDPNINFSNYIYSITTNETPPSGGDGSSGGGGGGGGSGYVPPTPKKDDPIIIEIPKDETKPVVITPPVPKPPQSKPIRKVTAKRSENRTVITVAPTPYLINTSSDLKIVGLSKNQRVKVTLFNLNNGKKTEALVNLSQANSIVRSNPNSKVEIEISPAQISKTKKGAAISISGAKKSQRVRVTIK